MHRGAVRQLGRKRYEALLITAFRDIATDPERVGSRPLPSEVGFQGRIYHLRHSRERARVGGIVASLRHFVIYRQQSAGLVRIVRILHEAMDLDWHLRERV